jgi:dihydrofolate synthase/folylpolyglutamate synthase
VAALGEEFPNIRWRLVFGVMGDKDAPAMLAALGPRVTAVHAVSANSPRALPADRAGALVEEVLGPDREVSVHRSVADGVAAAIGSGDPVLVTGSLYVVGEARIFLMSDPPGARDT